MHQRRVQMDVITGEKAPTFFHMPFSTWRSKCSRKHNSTTGGDHFSALSGADDAKYRAWTQFFKYNCSTLWWLVIYRWCCSWKISLTDVIQYVSQFLSILHSPVPPTHAVIYKTHHLLRCGPPSYRPSAVQSTKFYCQANKWLVSEAVSVYWLLILSLSRGWSGALHSLPLCSVTGKVLTLLISFFAALCQKIQLQTLKTSTIARHLQPHRASLQMANPGTLFLEGGGTDDRLCEWKMIGEHNLKPQQLSFSLSLSSLTQRKYCTLTGFHWIPVVIHRPISNCQAAKLHQVCQNSSQEHAGDVKN